MKKIYTLLISAVISMNVSAQVYSDVAGIFYNRCTQCHHQNQHAPSFMYYSEVFCLLLFYSDGFEFRKNASVAS